MHRSKLDNQTLDKLGKALICVEARRTTDIDRIVGDPHLFARVKARIDDKVEQQSLAGSMSLPMFFRPQIAAVLTIVAAGSNYVDCSNSNCFVGRD